MKVSYPFLRERVENYLSEKAVSCFSLGKPSDIERTLAPVSEDFFQVVQQFMDDPEVRAMSSYSLILRVLNEAMPGKGNCEWAVGAGDSQALQGNSIRFSAEPV
jgi:hypothetical protein